MLSLLLCDRNMSGILCALTLAYFNVMQNRMIRQHCDKPILFAHMSNVTKKEANINQWRMN